MMLSSIAVIIDTAYKVFTNKLGFILELYFIGRKTTADSVYIKKGAYISPER